MRDVIKISRGQLKEIIGDDADAIRQFEKVFEFVADSIETGVTDAVVVAEARANEALSKVHELEKRVRALEP